MAYLSVLLAARKHPLHFLLAESWQNFLPVPNKKKFSPSCKENDLHICFYLKKIRKKFGFEKNGNL
jgi:hypothetical protein